MMNQRILEEILTDLPLGGIRYFDSVGSTNDEAAAWAEMGAPDYAIVLSDEQTKGRGRSGQKWFTFPGAALAFSLILRLSAEEHKELISLIPRFTGLGALAVSQALRNQYSLPNQIKWPNDILVNQKKLCGVLCEALWTGDQLSTLILGIGINITINAIPPVEILHLPATSVEAELGYSVERWSLLHEVLAEIVTWRQQLTSEKFLRTWEANLAYQGEWVRILSSTQPGDAAPVLSFGRILGLEVDGGLRVRTSSGNEVVFRSGDVAMV